MNITYKNKKYCISPCAKDKFQRFIINPISWLVTGISITLGLGVLLELLGFVFVTILFYGFGVGVTLGTLFDCVFFGLLALFLYMIYSVFNSIYVSIKYRTITSELYAILFVVIFSPLFVLLTVSIGFGEFLFFLLHSDTYVWIANRDFGFGGLIENSFILGLIGYLFVALFVAIGGIIWNLKDIVLFFWYIITEVKNKVHDTIDKRYETKYKKECKLFVECTE